MTLSFQHLEILSRNDLIKIISFTQQCLSCANRDEFHYHMVSLGDYLGFEFVLYGYSPTIFEPPLTTELINLSAPTDWMDEFAEGHRLADPVRHEIVRQLAAGYQAGYVYWDAYKWSLSPEQQQINRRRRHYGLNYGCTVFANSQTKNYAFFLSFSGKRTSPDARTEVIIKLLLPHFMTTGKRLSIEETAKSLTKREKDVARALLSGMNNREIATHLGMTGNTVKYHLKGIYPKLHVKDRQQVQKLLQTEKLLQPETLTSLLG